MTINKYTWPIIALLLGYILFLHMCKIPIVSEPETEVIVRTDTVWLPSDTLIVPGPPQRIYLSVPDPSPADSLGITTYTESYIGRYISMTITARVMGRLDSWEFEYIPKVRQITQRQMITAHTTVTHTRYIDRRRFRTSNILVGVTGYTIENEPSLFLTAGFSLRSSVYLYGYDPLLNSHKIGVLRRFSF